MQTNENITTTLEDEDVMLPEGYTGGEGEDLFDEASWGGTPGAEAGQGKGDAGQAQQPAGTPGGQGGQEPAGGDGGGQAPTTGREMPPAGDGTPGDPAAPTTGGQNVPAAGRLRFKARVDHQDRDVELDESELPSLYQKAQITERLQAKENQAASRLTMAEEAAKRAGFDGLDSLLESVSKTRQEAEVRRLTMEGVHEDVAKDMAARKFAPPSAASPAADTQQNAAAAQRRDFRAEAAALLEARPDLRGKPLPDAVLSACRDGKPLAAAVYEYELGQARAEAERLRQENEIMRQNAANAARAPVSATQGGGATDTRPEDDFLKGFNSDY